MSGRILIIESAAPTRALLKAKLTGAYHEVVAADTAETAHAAVRSYAPDLVIVDAAVGTPDGYALCSSLQAEPRLFGVPVMMIVPREDSQAPLHALTAGSDDFLRRPYTDAALFARVKNMLQIKTMADDLQLREKGVDLGLQDTGSLGQRAGRVMLAAETEDEAADWSLQLSAWVDCVSRAATSASDALRRAAAEQPDVILVSERLADGSDGLRLISALRSQPGGRDAAVLVALSSEDPARVQAAYDVGATDYLSEPIESAELVARVQSLVRRKRRAEKLRAGLLNRLRQAMTDPLTGLANRRHAIRQLNQLITPGQPQKFAVAMLDLDRFKRINDSYGHGVGDAVLKEFARRLKVLAKSGDTVARLGGEEFLVIQPGAGRREAEQLAESIRSAIDEHPFVVSDVGPIRVTVSIGVATAGADCTGPASVLEQADRALYVSKSGGRNKVTVYFDAA